MSYNKTEKIREMQVMKNRNLRQSEISKELKRIREQVCGYLLQGFEDINCYGSELIELEEITENPKQPEEMKKLNMALRSSINILLIYEEDKNTRNHLEKMFERLINQYA